MARLRVKFSPTFTLTERVESKPEMFAYASAPALHTQSTTECRGGIVVDVFFPVRVTTKAPAVLGLDVYTTVTNSKKEHFRVHSCYATLDLYKVMQMGEGTGLSFQLVNKCYLQACTKCTVKAQIMKNQLHFEVPESPPIAPIEQRMRKRIMTSISQLSLLSPAYPILKDVLAPVYQGRIMALPGEAYFCKQSLFMTEECAMNMLNIVLARHGMTPETFAADLQVASAAGIMAEFCTAFPASFPYAWDVYPDRGKLHAYESFDDLLRRGSGDCEDFSKCVANMFGCVRFNCGPKWCHPALRRLHQVSKYYVAGGVLGTINYGGSEEAHMHCEFHPLATFTSRCPSLAPERTFEPFEYSLPVLMGEATVNGYDPVMATTQSATKCFNLPNGYEQARTDCVGSQTFYLKNAHFYSNYWVERDKNLDKPTPAFFSFLSKPNQYGITFGVNGGGIFMHPPLSTDDRRDINTILSLHQQPIVLQSPQSPQPPQFYGAVATRHTTEKKKTTTGGANAGWPCALVGADYGAKSVNREVKPSQHLLTQDFYCTTSSTIQATQFRRSVLGSAKSVEYIPECFCAGYRPQLRIRVVF